MSSREERELLEKLQPTHEGHERSAHDFRMKSKEAVRRRIANQVRLDFAQGAVVSVDGWLLSLTEARVYALVALSPEME